ncbi:helix-turn-helix domain-containing protein [Actinotignum sp. GS-2025b]|uniref:helix-turn-helix domain-containing protein n=1 Tax=Actinotignum sp. GS-2025b TaxID=3427275 RepID=UPI003F45D0BF
MSDAISPPRLYSLKAVSEAGYGSITTLRRAIRNGDLRAVFVGGRVKISADALDEYVRESSARTSQSGGE